MQFQKKSIPTSWKVVEFPRREGGGGGGSSKKAKILEAKYGSELEFNGGRGGAKQKTFLGMSKDICFGTAK